MIRAVVIIFTKAVVQNQKVNELKYYALLCHPLALVLSS